MKADMDNTGMYVRYIPITREEVIEFCKKPEILSGSEGFAEKIEKQIEYKDLISRKYKKARMTSDGVKKTYMNIYAHKLYGTTSRKSTSQTEISLLIQLLFT